MKNMKLWAVMTAVSLFFVACGKDPDPVAVLPYESGVFITHEGAFTGGTGSVSFYNRTVGGIKTTFSLLKTVVLLLAISYNL